MGYVSLSNSSTVFEKIFGTSAYTDIEEYLQNKYNLSYYKATEVLYYTNNDKYIYNPFK